MKSLIVREYLARLGVRTDPGLMREINKFNSTVLKGTAVLGTAMVVANVALFKMMKNVSDLNLKTVKTDNALKAMGKTMEEINKSPELRRDYSRLMTEGDSFTLPADYKAAFNTFKEVNYEVARFKQIGSYSIQWVGYYLNAYLAEPLNKVKGFLKDINDGFTKDFPGRVQKLAMVISWLPRLLFAGFRTVGDLFKAFKKFFDALPEQLQAAGLAFLAFGAILKMNPFFRMITFISTILLLLDDFYGYLDGKESALGPVWEKLIGFFENLGLTGEDAFRGITGAIAGLVGVMLSEKVFSAFSLWFKTLAKFKPAFSAIKIGGMLVFSSLGAGVFKLGGMLLKFGGAIRSVIGLIRNWGIAQGLLNMVMMANPISLTIAAIAALIAIGIALIKNWDKVKKALGKLWDKFKETFPNAAALIEGVIEKVQKLINIVKDAVGVVVDGAKKMGDKLKNARQTEVEEELGGFAHAQGGVFYGKHRATIGEDGPEAIIPLNKPDRAREILGQVKQALGGVVSGINNTMQAYNYPIASSVNTINNQDIRITNTNNNNIYGVEPNATAKAVNNNNNAMLIRSLQGVIV